MDRKEKIAWLLGALLLLLGLLLAAKRASGEGLREEVKSRMTGWEFI